MTRREDGYEVEELDQDLVCFPICSLLGDWIDRRLRRRATLVKCWLQEATSSAVILHPSNPEKQERERHKISVTIL
jgi:hypothetical protein